MLNPSVCKLVSNLMGKFVYKRILYGVEFENLLVDIHLIENRKLLQFVEIRTKTKSICNELTHLLKISQDKPATLKKST